MKNIKNIEKATIKAEYSRHFPDPLNKNTDGTPLNIEHHILLSRAVDVPSGISLEADPRAQNIDRGIYKEVRKSLDNTDDLSFHLKNKGITILAHHVEYSTDKRTADLYLGHGHGIVDGAHTYQIVLEANKDGTCPEGQYIKFEVLTGVPHDMGPEISGGLNTAVQVDEASLMNLTGEFDWVKRTLQDTDYAHRISYKMNEQRDYDIREILGIMTLFHVNKFPYPKHPKDAYVSKAKCLHLYRQDSDSFKMLQPLLKDILHLHDYVHIRSRERYNEASLGRGRAGRMKGVYAKKQRKPLYDFWFIGEQNEYKLYDGSLYPMLGAMRFLVEQKPGEDLYSWKLKSLDEIKAFFDEVAPELVATTHKTSELYGRKPNPIGKDENHWDNLYKTVALHYLTNYS